MAIKYTRQDFRDRAKGTQRFAGQAGGAGLRGRLSAEQSRFLVLLTLPLVIVLLLFGGRLMPPAASKSETVEDGEGVVVRKELKTSDGVKDRYEVEIEVKLAEDRSCFSIVEVDRALWESLESGQLVHVRYGRLKPGGTDAEPIVVEIHDIRVAEDPPALRTRPADP